MKMVKILWSATFTTDMNFETLFMWNWKAIYLRWTCSWRTQFLKDFNFQCPWNSILLKCWTILLWECDGRTVNTSTRWPSNMHPGYLLLSGYLPPVNTWIIDICHWGNANLWSDPLSNRVTGVKLSRQMQEESSRTMTSVNIHVTWATCENTVSRISGANIKIAHVCVSCMFHAAHILNISKNHISSVWRQEAGFLSKHSTWNSTLTDGCKF